MPEPLTLSDHLPVLLGPVRLEYRFTDTHLLVRVFPDDWAVDSFEERLTTGEQEQAARYWLRHWAAAGDATGRLDAWRRLTAHVGPGRAAHLAGARRPVNPADEPVRTAPGQVILVAPGAAASLPAADRAPARTHWRSVYRAGGNATALRTADTALDTAVGAVRAARIRARRPDGLDREPATGSRATADVVVAFLDLPTLNAAATRPSTWTEPARARLLPDRFHLLGYSGGQRVLEVTGADVPAELAVGPDPGAPDDDQFRATADGLHVPEPLRWLVDFGSAVDAGMGFRIPLDAPIAGGLDRLIVLGVRAGDPDDSRVALETLIRHQADSRAGFRLLPQGTPTNNTGRVASALGTQDEEAARFDALTAPVAAATGEAQRTDGQWLADLLGIDPALVATIPGRDGTDHLEARAMNTALWPATWGYHLGTMLHPMLGTAALDATREFFLRFVSGRGPLPAVRVGRQPYGILATTAFSKLSWADDHPQVAHRRTLHGILSAAAADWAELVDEVPRLGADGDPHALLLGILGLHPASTEFHLRYAQSIEDYFNRLNLTGDGPAAVDALGDLGLPQRVRTLLTRLGHPPAAPDPDAVTRLFVARQHPLHGPLVDDRPLSETAGVRPWATDGRNYLAWLAAAARTDLDVVRLESGFTAEPPVSLLYLLLRHAVLNAYDEAALRLAAAARALSDADVVAARREAPFVHISERTDVTESRYGRLYSPDATVTGDPATLLAEHVAAVLGEQPATRQLAEQLDSIDLLADLPTARLERVLVEHLDVATYRLDAWRVGLAVERLVELRRPAPGAPPVTGLHLGAFGWLEEVRPRDVPPEPVTLTGDLAGVFTPPGSAPLTHDPANQGFVHAPSPGHAATAAVLRAGYLADASRANPGTLAVNLSSERVRTALSFLDGIRGGQSLGALLGYRLERGLHDRHTIAETDSFLGFLRAAFPLVAARQPDTTPEPGTPITDVEARNVVDGLALVRHVTRTGQDRFPYGLTGEPPSDGDQRAAIDHEVQALIEINDAIADLAVAEGVHQAVLGNPERATASMDAFTRSGFPPDPEVIATPHAGRRLTHRVGLHLPAGVSPTASPVPGLALTPRGAADPAVGRWLAALLPDPAGVVCRVDLRDPVTGQTTTGTVTQANLGLQPIDLLWALRPVDDAAMSDLDDRIVGRLMGSGGSPADLEITIRYTTPVPGQTTLFQLAPLVAALRELLLAARPVTPGDLVVPAAGGLADPAPDGNVDLPRARPAAVRDRLTAFLGQIGTFLTDLGTLLAAPGPQRKKLIADNDGFLTRFAGLALTAGSFGLVRSGWGELTLWRRGLFGRVRDAVQVVTDRMAASLAQADALLAGYDALPAATPAEDRFLLLERAERLLTTTPATTRPPTPAQLRQTLTTRRTAFAAKRTALIAAPRNNRLSTGVLFSGVAAQQPVTAFDPTGLDLTFIGETVEAFLTDLRARATGLRDEVTARLGATGAALADYDRAAAGPERVAAATAAIRAALGPDALATSEFGITAQLGTAWQTVLSDSQAGKLFRHLDRDFPVDDWLHGVARVRPRMAQWERIALLGGAVGRGERTLQPAQFPYAPNDPWLALDLPPVGWSHLNPGSGLANNADVDLSGAAVPVRFLVTGDFDGDGRAEVAAAEETTGTRGNDFWVTDYDPATGRWSPLGQTPGLANNATFDASGAPIPARFGVAGDFDGDGRDEIAIGFDATGTLGNDFWVMDYDPAARRWAHLNPASGLANNADFSCTTATVPARFAVAGDFDGDGRDELAIAPDAAGSRGNVFWVMDYDPATGQWKHLNPDSGLANNADVDCSPSQLISRFAVAGDFDGDGRDELAVAIAADGTRGNVFWVMDYDPATGQWSHLNPGSGLANNGDVDCSASAIVAHFAVAGDFDGDGRAELAVAEDTAGTRGNDFWVMDYDPATGDWSHLNPTAGLENRADFSSSDFSPTGDNIVARFGSAADVDGDGRDEIVIARSAPGSHGNDFWVMDYDPVAGLWTHLGPAPAEHGRTGDFDCSSAQLVAKIAVTGDVDGDGRAEVLVAPTSTGATANDLWAMRYDPSPRTPAADRLLYTAHYGEAFNPQAKQCALLLDEWTEAIPETTATTAIAVHHDRPGTQPPQTMLLVAPPARTGGSWIFDDLVAAVGETLDLARLRAVEPAQLGGTAYAQLLPATVLSAAARPITIGTDLSLNNEAPPARGPFRPAKG